MIKSKLYNIPITTTLSISTLSTHINSFWTDIFYKLESLDNKHLLLLAKVRFTTGEYRTLADLRMVNFSDKELFLDFIINRLGLLADSYQVNPVSAICFTYVVKDGLADGSRALLQTQDYQPTTHVFNSMKIPNTMDISKYGELFGTSKIGDGLRSFVSGISHMFVIDSKDNTNSVHIPKPADLKWTDTKLTNSLFKR